jgi:hypothetical protein
MQSSSSYWNETAPVMVFQHASLPPKSSNTAACYPDAQHRAESEASLRTGQDARLHAGLPSMIVIPVGDGVLMALVSLRPAAL